MKCKIIDLGLIEYQKAYRIQKEILKNRQLNESIDTIIFLEHFPVFTIGRCSSIDNNINFLKEKGIFLYKIDRGGNITYHGPGQMVIYPIFDLRGWVKDIHIYIRRLEEVVIKFLKEYGISGSRIKGFTGVWVSGAKIASIGIGISRWVTYHGLAINIDPEMEYFSMINPCGIRNIKMISLAEILSSPVDMEDVKEKIIKAFEVVFRLEIIDLKTNEPIKLT